MLGLKIKSPLPSSFHMGSVGIKLKSSGLDGKCFNCWSILAVPEVAVLFIESFLSRRILLEISLRVFKIHIYKIYHFENTLETVLHPWRKLPTLPQHSSLQWWPQLPFWPFVHLCQFPLLLHSVLPWVEQKTLGLVMKCPWKTKMILYKAHFNWTWKSKSIPAHSSVVMNMIYIYKLSRATSLFILMLWETDMP